MIAWTIAEFSVSRGQGER